MNEFEKRLADLEQRNNDLAVRHAALLTQNVQQEEEITKLEEQVCGMRKALDRFTSWYSEPINFPDRYQSGERAYLQARSALASVPECRHEERARELYEENIRVNDAILCERADALEEKERADMLHDLLKLSQEEVKRLKEEIETDDKLLAERNRILEKFPCPEHGPCVPYIIKYFEALRRKTDGIGGSHTTHPAPG